MAIKLLTRVQATQKWCPFVQVAQLKHKFFGQAALPLGTQTTIFTATATDIVKTIWICNTTAAPVDLYLWVVPKATAVADSLKIFHDYTIAADSYLQIQTEMPFDVTGMTLQGECSAADALVVTVFGTSEGQSVSALHNRGTGLFPALNKYSCIERYCMLWQDSGTVDGSGFCGAVSITEET